MNTAFATSLLRQTLWTPRAAADRIIALNLPRNGLWMALALMSVLNGMVYSVVTRLAPPQDAEALQMLPPVFQSPALFTMFLLGALVITVMTLTWIGQAMGGTGGVPQVLALMVWLQVLRLGLQLALSVLMLALPVAGLALMLMATVWGVIILVAFIDRAHEFHSSAKAIAVIVLAVLAVIVGLSAILSVIAAVAVGGA